jgi:hypothetical protein
MSGCVCASPTHTRKRNPPKETTYNVGLEVRQNSGQGHSRRESEHGDEKATTARPGEERGPHALAYWWDDHGRWCKRDRFLLGHRLLVDLWGLGLALSELHINHLLLVLRLLPLLLVVVAATGPYARV